MKIVDRGTLFDASQAPPQERFCSFASLTRLSDGSLAAAFRVGSSKDSVDEDLRIALSADGGATWAVCFAGFGDLPPGSGGRIRSGGLTEFLPGRAIGVFNPFDRSGPPRPLANPDTQGTLPSRFYVGETPDGGRSWERLREVPIHPHTGALTGRILLLRDGAWALPYEEWKEYDDPTPGEHHARLLFSADCGQTWSGPVTVAHDPAGRVLYWDQRLAIHPRDGRMVAAFWTHDRQAQQDLPIHLAWGSPDGRSWTEPFSTGIAGQIFAPLYLDDGRLFAAYVHRHAPPGLRALLSADDGRSWPVAGELEFYQKPRRGHESGMSGKRDFGDYWADMNVWTFGHPTAVQLPSGEVLVAFYAGDEAAMGIHWVRIAL